MPPRKTTTSQKPARKRTRKATARTSKKKSSALAPVSAQPETPPTQQTPPAQSLQPSIFKFGDAALRERLETAARHVEDEQLLRTIHNECLDGADGILRAVATHPKSNDILARFFAGTPQEKAVMGNLAQLLPDTKALTLAAIADVCRSYSTLEGIAEITRIAASTSGNVAALKDLLFAATRRYNSDDKHELLHAVDTFAKTYALLPHALAQFALTVRSSLEHSFGTQDCLATVRILLREDIVTAAREVHEQPELGQFINTLSMIMRVTHSTTPEIASSLHALHDAYKHHPRAHAYILASTTRLTLDTTQLPNIAEILMHDSVVDVMQRVDEPSLKNLGGHLVHTLYELIHTANPGIVADMATFALAYAKPHQDDDATVAVGAMARVAEETQDDQAVQHILNVANTYVHKDGLAQAIETIMHAAQPKDPTIPLDAQTLQDSCQPYLVSATSDA